MFLAKDHPGWKWEGVIHEYLTNQVQMQGEIIDGVINESNTIEGNRSKDPKKYLKDAEVLEQAILRSPENTRYMFYLAQSYANAKDYEKAIIAYEKRAAKSSGDQNEIFWSLYAIGILEEVLQKEPSRLIDAYSKAFLFDQTRAEPIFRIGRIFFSKKNYLLSALLAEFSMSLPAISRTHFGHLSVYDYEALLLHAESSYMIGKKKEALSSYLEILKKGLFPKEIEPLIYKNISALKKELDCATDEGCGISDKAAIENVC